MTKKRFEIDDDEDEYVIDNKTGKLYDACGGGDGLPFIINEYDKLEKENKELEEDYDYLEKRFKEEEWHYEHIDEDRDVWMHKCHELEKENEQLKEEKDYFERKKCEYFNKYNKKHLDNIQLKKENEQLKSRIKELEIKNEAQSDAIDGLQGFIAHYDLEDLE